MRRGMVILIYSKTLEQHRKQIYIVLKRLDEADLRVSPDKSFFQKQEGEALRCAVFNTWKLKYDGERNYNEFAMALAAFPIRLK